jgi:hypothetical protein
VGSRAQGNTAIPRRRQAGFIRIGLLAFLLALALPASAQATWQSLGRLSAAGQDASSPQVGVDSNGNAVLVWVQFDGTRATDDPATKCCFRVFARTRSAAGALGPVESISAAGKNTSVPQVAVDPAGNAVFTWALNNGTNDVIQARRRSAAGALSAIQTLSAAGQNAEEPQVAVDPNGNAVFVWERFDGSNPAGNCCFLIQTRRRASTGTLSAIQTLSTTGQSGFSPQVGIDTNGNAVYAWTAFTGTRDDVQLRARTSTGTLSALQTLSSKEAGQAAIAVAPNGNSVITWVELDGTDLIKTRTRTATGTLSAVQILSTAGQYAEEPQVAIDNNGNAVFVWERFDGSAPPNCCWRIEARRRTSAGTLSAVDSLSAAGQSALAPQLGLDTNGNAIFVWGRSDGTSPNPPKCCVRIEARRRNSTTGALSAVQSISQSGRNAAEPQVAVDPSGNAIFDWTLQNGQYKYVQARRRSSTGPLSTLQTLSSVGPPASSPEVAVDPNGNAVFTWVIFDGTKNRIQARSRSATGALSALQILSDPGQNATKPQVAVDASGNAIFVWQRFDGTDPPNNCCTRIEARSRSSTGTLGAVETLSDPGQNASMPQVAVDSSGNAVFTWVRPDGTNKRIEARARSAAGTLGAVEPLSAAGQDADDPQVAVDPNGNAVFTWQRFDGTNPGAGCCSRIEVVARSATGTLSAVQLLSASAQNAQTSQVAVDSSGNAVVVWKRFNGTSDVIQSRARSATGTLGTVQNLSAAGENASQPQVAVGPTGNAVFAWKRFNGTNDVIQTRARTSTGTLSSVQALSGAGQNAQAPQLAVDSGDNAVFAWERLDGSNPANNCCSRIQSITRSAAGTLGAIQTLSAVGENASAAQIALRPSTGTAFATWQLFDGKRNRVEASVGP